MSHHIVAEPHHTYQAPDHKDIVLSEVSTVICVLLPRAFLVAGFDETEP